MSANTIRTSKIELLDNSGEVAQEFTLSNGKVNINAQPVDVGTYTREGVLTREDLLSFADTPVEIVPAPGAGKIIVPFLWQWYYDVNGDPYEAGAGVRLEYADADVTLTSGYPDAGVLRGENKVEGIVDIYMEMYLIGVVNAPIVATADDNFTDGDATNVVKWRIWYNIVDSLE